MFVNEFVSFLKFLIFLNFLFFRAVCIGGVVKCVVGVADEIKEEARKVVRGLNKMGLEVWMVTGDNHVRF